MQPPLSTVASSPPRVFNYSLDWRFLLPVAELNKGRFLFEENTDFSQTLEHVGVHTSQRFSFSDLKNRNGNRFPFLAMPFGLPVGWVGTRNADQVEFYSSMSRFIDQGGYLLVGFNNSLNWRAHHRAKYYPSTPQRARKELIQAGYKSVEIFGVLSNLQIPEYMFELNPRTLRFALQNRFRRKPAILRTLRVLSGVIGWKRLSYFLPCYFAVATA
ncbi:MAG TPA: hypothetical protein VJ830_01740 [Anaerolineales bacterium]|nr:hypothetical protein [Anaerolineales bacterium]